MSRAGRRTKDVEATRKRQRAWIMLGVGATILAVVTLLVLARPSPTPPVTDTDDPWLGSADAPATVFYFGDFQCPACRQFETSGMDELRTTYIEPGRVRLVFKDYPFIGDDSWTAAQASQFVWRTDPAEYWAWHRAIYEQQGAERSGWAELDRLVEYSAPFAGIDAEAMREAVLGNRHRAEAEQDLDEGRQHGVRSTPTLLVGSRLVNANDAEAVADAIAEVRP